MYTHCCQIERKYILNTDEVEKINVHLQTTAAVKDILIKCLKLTKTCHCQWDQEWHSFQA